MSEPHHRQRRRQLPRGRLLLLAVFLASPIGTHIICKVAYKQSLEAEKKGKGEA